MKMQRHFPDLKASSLLLIMRDVPRLEGTGHRSKQLEQQLAAMFAEVAASEGVTEEPMQLKDLFLVRQTRHLLLRRHSAGLCFVRCDVRP